MTGITGTTRAVLTLAAAIGAGALVWVATSFDLDANAGFWAAMGVLAAGGVLLGLAQVGRGDGNPAAMVLVAFLPVALVAGWVVLATQPEPSSLGDRVTGWTGDLGLDGLVESLGTFAGVLAFGTGVVFGLTLAEAFSRARESTTEHDDEHVHAHPDTDADEPTAAERRAIEAEARAEAAEREAAEARLAAEDEGRAARR